MKAILFLVSLGAAICFGGAAAAKAPSARIIDAPITVDAPTPKATEGQGEASLRVAPSGGCGNRCGAIASRCADLRKSLHKWRRVPQI